MIKELNLKNFRGFEDHTLRLRHLTTIVGRNNAGKSTIVEALTLLSLVVNRFQHTNFTYAPSWTGLPIGTKGIIPSLRGMEIDLQANVFHNLNDPPAVITATMSSGDVFTIYIGPQSQIFAIIQNYEGNPVTTKTQAQYVRVPQIKVLPQVGPLDSEEVLLSSDHVIKWMNTSRSPLHFRNQLLISEREEYEKFVRLAEAHWHGLHVTGLETDRETMDNKLALYIRDGDFEGEIGWMGHGLQMWLQVMWFLARTNENSTIILDEPDVYMHPDLQRRLVRLVKDRYAQTIIATHSVEILAEVDPDDVLVVDRSRPRSSFANTLPAVQHLIDHMGGVHNLHLARLASSRRFLLVEGKDVKFLKEFQDAVYPHSEEPFDTIPSASLGGWANWRYAFGSSMVLKNAAGQAIKTYLILDRDYHSEDEILELTGALATENVYVHVWERKEIENYLLVPSAIARLVASKVRKGKLIPDVASIASAINGVAESLRDVVFDSVAGAFEARTKGHNAASANRFARNFMDDHWSCFEEKIRVISGKEALARLSAWSQETYGVSFSPLAIAKELQANEIFTEVSSVVRSIESSQPFSNRLAESRR